MLSHSDKCFAHQPWQQSHSRLPEKVNRRRAREPSAPSPPGLGLCSHNRHRCPCASQGELRDTETVDHLTSTRVASPAHSEGLGIPRH
jgi:hypothetical protein